MTFTEFIRDVIGYEIRPLEFHILGKSVVITTHKTSKIPAKTFKVVALAISGPWLYNPFLFALAVEKKASRLQFTMLSRLWSSSDEEWMETRKIRFSRWVKEWLANHPEELIQVGITLGHKENAEGNIRVHYTVLERIRWITNLARVRSPSDPDFDADRWIQRARNDFHDIGDIAGNLLNAAGHKVIW